VSDDIRAKLAEWWEMQPVVNVPVPNDGAKVVVVKFNDYQCPACKATHEMYKPVFAKYEASQVRYVIKHFPLELECNPGFNAGHYASCEAAAGMVLARAKGTAPKLEEWIWANIGPPVMTPAQMRDGIKSVGGIADFDAQYTRALEEVKTDAGLGQLLKVASTPTFFINGRKLPELVQPQFLDVIIELELKRAQ
jgi:protein-disulfide isomerase